MIITYDILQITNKRERERETKEIQNDSRYRIHYISYL